MFNFRKNSGTVRAKIREYLIESAFDYAVDCLGVDSPTDEQIKQFVVDDIKRVMDYRIKQSYGVLSQNMVKSYLLGLALSVDYTYLDEWNRLNEWTNEANKFEDATEKEIEAANEKYWNALSAEIMRWDRK